MVCIYTTGELSIAFFDLFISARPRAEAFAFPVAFSLDIFGDRWTLLVIRDLFYGRTRFKEFAGSPEGIPTNILTDRLERLLARGIIEQIPAEDGTKRLAYCLTKEGKALGPVLKAMRDWGLTWDKSTRVLA